MNDKIEKFPDPSELKRMQWLIDLADEYLEDTERKYLASIEAEVEAWGLSWEEFMKIVEKRRRADRRAKASRGSSGSGRLLSFGDRDKKEKGGERLRELRNQYADLSQQAGGLTLKINELSISGKEAERYNALIVDRESLQVQMREILRRSRKNGNR